MLRSAHTLVICIAAAAYPNIAATQAHDARIAVQDQRIESGNIVKVEQVTTPANGFLVIHATQGEKPVEPIGHAVVNSGSNSNVSVKLEKDVKSGDKLVAVLHEDTAANGMFDAADDKPLAKTDGETVMAAFVAQ